MTRTAKAVEPKPRVSGFCNVTLPRTTAYDPHQRCPGCDCTATNCPCNPEEPPVPDHLTEIQAEIGKPNSPEREAILDRIFGPDEPDPIDDQPRVPVPVLSGPDGSPEDAVAWLRSAADALNTATKGYDPEDWRDALRLLHGLRTVTSLIAQVDANLARWLYLHGEHGQHQTLDGIPGPFYIGRGRDSERWESAAAVQEYVDRKVQQHEGEFTPESVVEWVLEILPATASTALRKTAIKAAGMELDLYYTSEPGRIRIDLPKPPG